MTLPFERMNSLKNTRDFLRSLLDPKATPKVPKDIRKQAYSCLKHFPPDYILEDVAEMMPEMFGSDKEKVAEWLGK